MRARRLLACVCWSLFLASTVYAQPSSTTQQPSSTTQDVLKLDVLKLIAPDSIGVITCHPRLLMQDPSMKYMPTEVFTAMGLQYMGLDPREIERIDVIMSLPGPAGLQAGCVLTLSQDLPDAVLEKFERLDKQVVKADNIFRVTPDGKIYLHPKSPRQLLVGTSNWVVRAARSKGAASELSKLVAGLGEPSVISVVVALKPLRELLIAAADAQELRVIPGLEEEVKILASKVDMLAVQWHMVDPPVTNILLEAASPGDATEVKGAIDRLVKLGNQQLQAMVAAPAAISKEATAKALAQYMRRVAPEIEQLATFTVDGHRLVLQWSVTQMTTAKIGVVLGLFLPAVEAARNAARQMQTSNNQKQILLACHNYESAFRRWPSDVEPLQRLDDDAPAKLSWRVRILPFIDQGELYNRFHLDEPWDSPHNIKLLEEMPDTFKNPLANTPKGYTVYQMPTGAGMMLEPGASFSFPDCTDGTHNTITLVESTVQAATPWTKPGDMDPLEQREFLLIKDGMMNVGMLDGSVRRLREQNIQGAWEALLTRSGGEVIDWQAINSD